MENIEFKVKCEICGKEISNKEMITVEEARVCNNPDCIKKAEEDSWNEGDK